MNREVHYDFTKRWALDEGFRAEDAEAVAAANWACDVHHKGLLDQRYHWPLLGAPVVSYRRFKRAVTAGDLTALGEALHTLQDTIGHGFLGHFYHWHGIDRWEHRSPRVRARLEFYSRMVLASYLRKRQARTSCRSGLV